MSQPIYITTPLYYVNAAPHIGHSYTEVAADCLARYRRLKGDDVFFLTGTDEHGEKIAQAAAAKGQAPKAFADQASDTFRQLWELLGIAGSYTRFLRTTDPDHEAAVQRVLTTLKSTLKLGTYVFWYCVPCETSYALTEIDPTAPVCPTCQRPLKQIEEEDYYLNLEEHREWLRRYIEDHETFILPTQRRNEVLALLGDPAHPLPDLCITRPKDRVPWGIDVPFSPAHVTYVWFDALLNYITALGWPEDPRFHRYWNEAGAVHLIGKDILRHHALYWPIILRVLGVRPPKTIFAHGWWKIGEQKMSKSLGNIVDPRIVITRLLAGQPYAADVYRYFLLREIPFGQDGMFSEEALMKRLDSDLANDLGNLVNRTCSMIERYHQGRVPASACFNSLDEEIVKQAEAAVRQVESAMERLAFTQAVEAIMQLVSKTNVYVEAASPWKLVKQPEQARRLETVLCVLAESARIIAILLEPFMPAVSTAMWAQLGFSATQPRRLGDAARWGQVPAGQSIGPHPVLFPRSEAKKEA